MKKPQLKSVKIKTYLIFFCVFLSVVWIAGCVFGKLLVDEHSYAYEVFGFNYNLTEEVINDGDLWFSSKLEAGILGLIMIWFSYLFIRVGIISDDSFINKLEGKLETSKLGFGSNEKQKAVSKYDLKQVEEKTLFEDRPFTGECVSYHQNESKNSEHFYQDGIKILAKEWNDDGSLKSEVKYVDGKKEMDGNRTEWLKDGNSLCKIQFKDGKKHSEEHFIDEILNGRSTHWHPNGKKKVEKTYKNGMENGVRKEWNEDGKKIFEGNFVDGNEE
jgi:antitoxin component YwqK of YwqJK toxin-antitoxin module